MLQEKNKELKGAANNDVGMQHIASVFHLNYLLTLIHNTIHSPHYEIMMIQLSLTRLCFTFLYHIMTILMMIEQKCMELTNDYLSSASSIQFILSKLTSFYI
jgi:hypothetical protein